jgi:site-specific recombinase XerD
MVGVIPVSLVSAIPKVAGGRGGVLPRGIEMSQVRRLLDSCDRRRVAGRRDYVILVLLVRLGLRAGEVAALELDDIDWRQGEITIRGKGDRHERLPLPCDVGEALAAYLRGGRARAPRGCRAVFLVAKAPWGAITSATVRGVVKQACIRAATAQVGPHRLRHTAATEMLRHGATLPEVAEVLRHRRLQTTSRYAKVDQVSLRSLARPWPGATP